MSSKVLSTEVDIAPILETIKNNGVKELILIGEVRDIALEILYIQNNYPNLLALTTQSQTSVCNFRGLDCRILTTTDQLLNSTDFPFKILGAKTGNTPLAGKNLAMIIEAPEGQGIIVNVILNSSDHFADMKKLTNWVASSYIWK